MFSEPFVNSLILAMIAAGLSGLVTWIFVIRANAKQTARDVRDAAKETALTVAVGHKALIDEVAGLKEKLQLVTAQVVPFNTAFQQILIAQLTHMHTPELDALMRKIGPPMTLTLEEEERMHKLLRERQHDQNGAISQEEREAALILPYVMRRARVEQEQIALGETMVLQTVGSITIPDTAGPTDEKK